MALAQGSFGIDPITKERALEKSARGSVKTQTVMMEKNPAGRGAAT